MDIKYKVNGNNLFVYLYGDLDEFSALSAKKLLDDLIDDHLNTGKVIFDLSNLTFMDSTGIGMIIGRYKKLKKFNIPTYLTGAKITIEKIIELSGLYSIMPKY